jgi:hypothetical protein
MWATVAEIVRIGNDHLGPLRGGLIPWDHHVGGMFVAAMVAFFLIAAVQHWRDVIDATGSPEPAGPNTMFMERVPFSKFHRASVMMRKQLR